MRFLTVFFAGILFVGSAFAGALTVTNVTMQQRYPWNDMVDIMVTISGESNDVSRAICSFAATNTATGTELKISDIAQNGADTGSGTTWTRRYIWNAATDVGNVKIEDVTLAVEAEIDYGGVQLWENGPYWAECNVGATSPEDYGYYFWWGDTVGYTRSGGTWTGGCFYSCETWVSSSGTKMSSSPFSSSTCPTYGKNNSSLLSAGYIDSTGNLVAKYDAATVHLGAPWRMPTYDEIGGLVNNCTTTWTTRNGVYGCLVIGKGDYASKSIFLPATGLGSGSNLYYTGSLGYYWSSSPNSDISLDLYELYAYELYFYSSDFYRCSGHRCDGRPVRSVRGFAN